eukprot:345579-Ditylum_brightwellii.AAC.1
MLGVEAIVTLTIPPFMASAAGGEYSFSMCNKVRTTKRNMFDDGKLDSISQIRMNLKQLDKHMAVYNENISNAIVNYLHSVAFVQCRNNAGTEIGDRYN